MNKKGFTLMELLLVVAVLAIVAAAAAPTFFNGSQEALQEAKKASFLSAYQNALSGANIYISIEVSKGNTVNSEKLTNSIDTYAPAATRAFNLQIAGHTQEFLVGYLIPFINETDNQVYVGYVNNETDKTPAVNDSAKCKPITANMSFTDLVNHCQNISGN